MTEGDDELQCDKSATSAEVAPTGQRSFVRIKGAREARIREEERQFAREQAEVERKLKFRELRIAVVAVFATALVGIAGSITTLVATLYGQSSESQRSADDFQRSQQQIAYAEFINRVSDFYDRDNVLQATLAIRTEDRHPPVPDEMRSGAWDALLRVKTQLSLVQLVASKDTVQAAEEIQSKAISLHSTVTDPQTLPVTAQHQAEVGRLQHELQAALSNFVSKARHDLDAHGGS